MLKGNQELARPPGLPGWPRALRLEFAAGYVGMAPSTWLREVAEGRAPKPVRLTPGCVVWLLEQLNGWLDDRAAEGQDRKRPNDFDEGADP